MGCVPPQRQRVVDVQQLLASPDPPSELATSNTSHLVTMFNSISSAPRPIVCINHHFAFPSASTPVNGGKKGPASGQKKGRGGKDEAGSKMIKVDVVGRGGKEWIRTNTSVVSSWDLLELTWPKDQTTKTHVGIPRTRLVPQL